MSRFTLLAAFASLVLTAPSPWLRAADAPKAVPANIASGIDESKLKAMPWHLGDMWWDLGEAVEKEDFQSLEADFEIKGEVPDSLHLYIAPIGLTRMDGQDLYGGIQTNTGMCRSVAQPAENQRRTIGRAGIFSLWADRDLASIQPSEGGYFDSAGHEGDFVSVRHPFKWAAGRYTYRVSRLREEQADGKPRAWLGAFLINHQTGEETLIGSLRTKGLAKRMWRKQAAFVEVYGAKRPLAELPFGLEVTFFVPRFNGKPVAEPHGAEQFDPGIPDFLTITPVDTKGQALVKPKPGEVAGMRFKMENKPVKRQRRDQWLF